MNYQVTEKKHQPIQLKKDVDFAYKLLKEGHPGVYWFINKEKLDFKFDSLKQTIINPLTTREFFIKLSPIIAEVKCGHTRLALVSKTFNKSDRDSLANIIKPISQLIYRVIDKRLYITSFNKQLSKVKKGDEILEIEGISTPEIINSLTKSYASDGYNQTFKTAVLNRAFAAWYVAIYDNKDTLNFKIKGAGINDNLKLTTFKKVEHKVLSTTVNSSKSKNKDSLLLKRKELAKELSLRYKGKDEFKKPLLDLNFLENDSSIAYLKVKSFSFPHANFDQFYKESFTALENGNTKDLILDLRDNGGGALDACRNLFSYLVDKDFVFLKESEVKKRFNPYFHSIGAIDLLKGVGFGLTRLVRMKRNDDDYFKLKFKGVKPMNAHKNHYDGNIYVLINGYTFSASALLSSNLKEINRAIFVGQETGGGYNGCVAGNIPTIQLPNSKLKLRMGLYPVIPNAQTTVVGRGIFPDIEITSSIGDIINGKDNELDWVLNHIKNKE